MNIVHIISVSGGKDSTAMYLRVLELADRLSKRGGKIIVVFADTGNEHEITLDYVRQLPVISGGPEVIWVKSDFTDDLARKRKYIRENWPDDGVPISIVERALTLLHPTGVPFLDLSMLKGRFPSRLAQFCTHELKVLPITEQIVLPALENGETVFSWQGVRSEESNRRRRQPKFERLGKSYWAWRPIKEWSIKDVFAIHDRHGVAPNPLYTKGMKRVGCMPCINCGKHELRDIAARFPDHIDRIEAWERLVSDVSKRGVSTFFAARGVSDVSLERNGIRERVEWSMTSFGGRQYNLISHVETNLPSPCKSAYGLCE